ncbi:Hint domain-containing protein [Actibacterium pelagium]|uniref:Hedgehog/Intein (Hint) domain-containing protein n=1 Tax=Actibacterium pelagium TaxID=2029103 RepID=A0A917ALD5_9RHOB|nr:Hint domain-containing protein [Actibacterium pelagium]GGE59225.1 hypothetical protein GCM10011517_28670 [Actibacterium pelagium]
MNQQNAPAIDADQTQLRHRSEGQVLPLQRADRPRAISRRYEISYLTEEGYAADVSRVAPATPQFEEAFSAFAHGTLFQTDRGMLAIEDIYPGLKVETEAGLQTVLWVGSMSVLPWSEDGPKDPCKLMRITAGSWGFDRPSQDLLLGSGARLLYRHAGCQELLGTDAGFAPARAFIDDESMLSVRPASSVRLFHLGFYGQQILRANGLEVESYHPGQQAEMLMNTETKARFLSLFPHIRSMEDFGPQPEPRLTRFEVENLRLS